MTNAKNLALLCGGALVSLACSKESEARPPLSPRNEGYVGKSDGPPRAQPAMAPASRIRSAMEQIAEARCHRERQCGNVGDDKTFTSAQDCLTRIQNDWKDDLNARQCPGGVNQAQLDECLGEIRSEECNNPFDTLARITECSRAQICIEQP